MSDLLEPIFTALGKNENPDLAFLSFDGFLRELPSGVQVFSLFRSCHQGVTPRSVLIPLFMGAHSFAAPLYSSCKV